jgi:hypothetical protein
MWKLKLAELSEELAAIVKQRDTTERTPERIVSEHARLEILTKTLNRNNFTLRQAIYEKDAGRPREREPSCPKCEKRTLNTWNW